MKKTFLIYIILLISFKIFSQDTIIIGVPSPYIKNESAINIFYQSHFSFEILYSYEGDKFQFEILSVEGTEIESDYLTDSKMATTDNKIDYLLYSTVQSNKSYLFFKVQLINPYSNIVVHSKYYIQKIDFTVNESLSDSVEELIEDLKSVELTKVERKRAYKPKKKKDVEDDEVLTEVRQRRKHEIFFMNGFFRNHANVMSYLEFFTGYNFSPFEFFSVEGGFFIGGGKMNNYFNIYDLGVSDVYLGGYGAFFFFLSGVVEPSVGLRFEFSYIVNEDARFTFPIDFGLKFYINNENAIRFDTTFQFITFNFNSLVWENNFIVGILLGYAKKI